MATPLWAQCYERGPDASNGWSLMYECRVTVFRKPVGGISKADGAPRMVHLRLVSSAAGIDAGPRRVCNDKFRDLRNIAEVRIPLNRSILKYNSRPVMRPDQTP